jgi:hypothetical protein
MALLDKIAESIAPPSDDLHPFCLLLRWSDSDSSQGEYGYSGRHRSYNEAEAAARWEMFWLEKDPDGDPDLFDENGEPIPNEKVEEAGYDEPDHSVIEAHTVNLWAAQEALDALRLAAAFIAKFAPFEGEDERRAEQAVADAIARLECRK